ncbi:MAG: copper amine oxidase N-terminal domain-containing protein [Epulopiscium sp.]|nr:copper amine oxidase N-terminal domain-containing protein [Candidatus Epulonipiscium sp.]
MKGTKKILTFTILIIMIFNISGGKVFAQNNGQQNKNPETQVNIIINGERFQPSTQPIIENGRILVPLRSLFEAMGIKVNWNAVEKTVYAFRENTAIQIAINSDKAFINEESVQLDQPAIIYRDSTYVPLRFIGEAFGGHVKWDSNTRTAEITTNFVVEPKVQEFTNMNIYVDKKIVNIPFNPVIANGIGLLPAEPILKHMGAKIYRDYMTGEIVAIKNETELRISIGEKTATVNGNSIQPVGKIIEYKETIYIPVKLLEQVFNATTAWNAATKEINIHNKQIAFVLPILPKEFIGGGVVPKNVPEPIPVGNTRLMVSDNPEKISERTLPYDSATLWQDLVKSDEDSIDHIVFGYHENGFYEPITIGITIENLSTTNEIEVVLPRGIARSTSRGWAIYDVGLKVAELGISNKLPIIPMRKTVMKPGETLLMDDFYVSSGNLIEFQHEFKVKKKSGTGELDYIIRTVVSQNDNTNLMAIKEFPLPLDLDNKHPRGTWDFAMIETELPLYEAGTYQTAYSVSNKVTDNLFSAESSFGKEYGTIGNIGHYGATYRIKIPVANNTGKTKIIKIRLNPRGGRCAAAVKTDAGFFITPEMNSEEATTIIEYTLEDGEEKTLEFEMMNAGGSSLPIAVNIITEN